MSFRDELEQNISVLTRVFQQIMKDEKFKRVLELVLAIGNYMNGGGFKG